MALGVRVPQAPPALDGTKGASVASSRASRAPPPRAAIDADDFEPSARLRPRAQAAPPRARRRRGRGGRRVPARGGGGARRRAPARRRGARGKKTALDLGCGAGHLRAALEADAVDGDVAGGIATLAQCDAAPEAVAACASRARRRRSFATTAVVADEERPLPFDDASFDAVLSSGSLHWVNDLPGALREVRRVLRPDGVFIGALAGAGTLGELQYCRRPARGRGIERRRPGARAAARARRRGGRGGANGRRRAAVLARRAPRGLRPAPPPGRL